MNPRQDFRVATAKQVIPPAEANPWWWHPGQAGVRSGPVDFEAKLASVDPDLAITWNAFLERWALWMRNPKNRYGWTLLFILKDGEGRYLPPDERCLARLYSASARRWGSAKEYFNAVEREIVRDREKREAKDRADQVDMAMEHWEHSQIKVGYGPNNGSKFADYHSGF